MTTIIYKNGVMVADGRTNQGSHQVQPSQKVFKLDNGILVGFSGLYPAGQAFVRHLHDPENNSLPEMDRIDVLVVYPHNPNLIYEFIASNIPSYIQGEYAAIGSGAGAAITLLKAFPNISAFEVMDHVLKVDIYSGPPVHYEFLDPVHKRQKNVDWLTQDVLPRQTIETRHECKCASKDEDDSEMDEEEYI